MRARKRVLLCDLRGLSPQLRGDANVLCVCCDGDSLGGAPFGEARFYARAQVYNERSSQDAGVKWRVYVLETLSVSCDRSTLTNGMFFHGFRSGTAHVPVL